MRGSRGGGAGFTGTTKREELRERTDQVTPKRVAKVASAEHSLPLRRKLAVEEAEDGPAAVSEVCADVQAARVPEADAVLPPEQLLDVKFPFEAAADGLPPENGPQVLQGPVFALGLIASVQDLLVLR